jgi:hypothetical protein
MQIQALIITGIACLLSVITLFWFSAVKNQPHLQERPDGQQWLMMVVPFFVTVVAWCAAGFSFYAWAASRLPH